jgi:hypothetical protein
MLLRHLQFGKKDYSLNNPDQFHHLSQELEIDIDQKQSNLRKEK